MKLIYTIGIALYGLAIRVASPFNKKAKLLLDGRGRTKRILAGKANDVMVNTGNEKWVWFHAASLGEFEQGRPVIEELKKREPDTKIVLTFFSPSGYEIRKNYAVADAILYLPADNRKNAMAFLDAYKPSAAVIVKYEYWYNFLTELKRRGVPAYLISAIFLPTQPFFKWWGGMYREMLGCFTKLFVQDEESLDLLNKIGVKHAVVTGDTRFDRVEQIATEAKSIPQVEKFLNGADSVVCGSTWGPDEENLFAYINSYDGDFKWIIAPHEIGEGHISKILSLCKKPVARITAMPENVADCKVLIVDCIGMLSAIYRYGSVSYIGGGFGVGIHNTLEAAVYGVPVIFGPNHKKFREALGLITEGGAFTYSEPSELAELLNTLLVKPEITKAAGMSARKYVESQLGATPLIVEELVK
ncbi:MAG: 3-deoxy-D-manno-octulosonic acid transferase [Marinifilaceae bacterium]|nr:3-deoxy-D-manno-octulosonic acid transferase [Marinifilaceae bacterium]